MLSIEIMQQIRVIYDLYSNNKEQQGQIAITKLLLQYPDNHEIYKNLAIIMQDIKKDKEARLFAQKSFDLEKNIENLELLAHLNIKCKNYEDAAIQFEELTKHTDIMDYYLKAAHSYEQLDFYKEAIKILKKGYEKYNNEQLLLQLINSNISYGDVEAASKYVKLYEQKFPNSNKIYSMLAFYNEAVLNNYEKAKEYYIQAAKTGDINAYYNLGSCCKNNEDYDEAEKYLKKLASFKDKNVMDYNYTLGSIYMAQRKLRQGYKYYIKRFSSDVIHNLPNYWDGKACSKGTICICREQGFGDNIQFLRYLPIVAKKFKKLYFLADGILLDLFKRSLSSDKYPNIEIKDHNEDRQLLSKCDRVALIMDLPYLLNMTYYNIPAEKSYLIPDKDKVKYFKEKYFNNDKLKIVLNWRSKGMGIRDAMYRTIDAPYYLRSLFDIPNVQYYSLQFGDIFDMNKKFPQMIDLRDEVKTFDDSAAILENADLVITVDSGLTHLAGGLGKKTYLLLCKAPDWRWFDNREKTEWYPSVKIFRQKDRRSWDDVSEKLIETVKKDAEKWNKKK